MKKKLVAGLVIMGMIVSLTGCAKKETSSKGNISPTNAEINNSDTAKDSDAAKDTDTAKDSGAAKDSDAVTAKADENGNYIINGSFEDSELTGWTVNNVDNVTEEINIYSRKTDCYDGAQCLHFYSSKNVNFTAEQALTGLEAGNYKLTGYVQGDTAGDKNSSIYFYAVINGETVKADTSLNGYLTWNTVELKDLKVTDGNIKIGVSVTNAPGGWGTIDKITLVKE